MRPPHKEIWCGDHKCINVECSRDIPTHMVDKQFTHPKNRVCRSCRNKNSIRWKCVGCDKLISNSSKRLGTFYCSIKCREFTNHFRTSNVPIIKNIVGCNYCTKPLKYGKKIKFCDSKCIGKQRQLEKHKAMYKSDMIRRANARNLVKHPNYDKEKREKHSEKQKLCMKRRYNIKKLVNKIRSRETHI